MADATNQSIQVRVDALPGVYAALAQHLQASGLTAAQLHEAFSLHLSCECVECGIRITGEDLGRLALASSTAELADYKLIRLKQGYCARKECGSYYYQVRATPCPGVDWAAILDRARPSAPADVPPTGPAAPPPAGRPARDPRVKRLVVGLALVAVLLICRYYLSRGHLPFVHPTPKYVVDPNSVVQ